MIDLARVLGGVKLGVEGEKRSSVGDMKDTEPGLSYTFEPVYTFCVLVLCLKCCYCVDPNKVIH